MKIRQMTLVSLATAAMMGACAPAPDGDETGTAMQALHGDEARQPAQYCRIVLSKLVPGEIESHVVSRDCYTSEEALSAARQTDLTASVLMMTWYVDAGFKGSSTSVEGKDGPCDSAGYGIRYVGDGWNDKISSFKAWNHCNLVTGYTDKNYGGTPQAWVNPGGKNAVEALDVSYVGDKMNDKISSFRLSQH